MTAKEKLHAPILIAVWPGMGHVAISAGFYLMSKLGMHQLAELSAEDLFDVDHVDVKDGLIQTAAMPRSRFFLWSDPDKKRDIVIFIGEAQPPRGKYAFCQRIAEFGKALGVQKVFTFAAMATQMSPTHESRVFAAATDSASLAQLLELDAHVLDNGNIGGLNGVLLGAAAGQGMNGACLLGEMPHIFTQLPYPKASLAVLRVFAKLGQLDIDFTELEAQSLAVDEQLGELLAQVEQRFARPSHEAEEQAFGFGSSEEESLSPADDQRIEHLFGEATADRSKAYELKAELDRLGVFAEYEDRFLDLFSNPE